MQCVLYFFTANHFSLKEYEIITLIYTTKTCSLDLLWFCLPKGNNYLSHPVLHYTLWSTNKLVNQINCFSRIVHFCISIQFGNNFYSFTFFKIFYFVFTKNRLCPSWCFMEFCHWVHMQVPFSKFEYKKNVEPRMFCFNVKVTSFNGFWV